MDGIHDHASGLEAAALIGSAYRNLHNLFDKQPHKTPEAVLPSLVKLASTDLFRSKNQAISPRTRDLYLTSRNSLADRSQLLIEQVVAILP